MDRATAIRHLVLQSCWYPWAPGCRDAQINLSAEEWYECNPELQSLLEQQGTTAWRWWRRSTQGQSLTWGKENVRAYLSVNIHWLAAALMVWRALATELGGTDDTCSTATVGWVARGARLVPSATNTSVGLFQVISSQPSVCSPCDRKEGLQREFLSLLSLYHLERSQCPS